MVGAIHIQNSAVQNSRVGDVSWTEFCSSFGQEVRVGVGQIVEPELIAGLRRGDAAERALHHLQEAGDAGQPIVDVRVVGERADLGAGQARREQEDRDDARGCCAQGSPR